MTLLIKEFLLLAKATKAGRGSGDSINGRLFFILKALFLKLKGNLVMDRNAFNIVL